jgi:hypothetical protein
MRPGRKASRIPELNLKRIWKDLGEEPPAKIVDADGKKKKRDTTRPTRRSA